MQHCLTQCIFSYINHRNNDDPVQNERHRPDIVPMSNSVQVKTIYLTDAMIHYIMKNQSETTNDFTEEKEDFRADEPMWIEPDMR